MPANFCYIIIKSKILWYKIMKEYLTLAFNQFVNEVEKNLNKQNDKLSYLCEILDIFLDENNYSINEVNVQKRLYIENKINNLKNKKANSIVLAQINPQAGNISYNAKKIINYIKSAKNINAQMIVFPELALMGYPIHDTIDRFPFIVDENIRYLKQITKFTNDITAIIGFVEKRENVDQNCGKMYYNSLAVIKNGKIESVVRKCLLPNYSEFNDYRYIEPSTLAGCQYQTNLISDENKLSNKRLLNINNVDYALSICEDCWNDSEFFENNLYNFDPIYELSKLNPDIFINISASPTRTKKEQLKHNMLSFVSKKYKKPFIYVNQTGSTDEVTFDGASRIYDENGNLIVRLKSFSEQFYLFEFIKDENNKLKYDKTRKVYPLAAGLDKTLNDEKKFTLDYENDLMRTYLTIKCAIYEYFKKNNLKHAVLGLSGGLDSSVCACLVADAIGKENVYGVSMPSKITSDESKNDAKILAQNLGINFIEVPIKSMVDEIDSTFKPLFNEIENKWNFRYKKSYTMDNIQARSRAIILWGIANEFEACIPIATSDKSELYMGYATINGDMSGGFAPIADVPKTKVFALARFLNKNREEKNAIPVEIINKKPGAELAIDEKTGKPLIAEDALMPYEFLDEVIWRIENKRESYFDMINSTFFYETKNNLTKEQKQKWLEKFFTRMSKALYKWTIMPPSCIVESRSINKNDYRQSVISNKINFCNFRTDDEIFNELESYFE